MKNYIRHTLWLGLFMVAATACEDEYSKNRSLEERLPISLTGEINQVAITRVNDAGFCDGDVMGVYVVDYNNGKPGALLDRGNRGDNVRHTFNEATFSWKSAYDLYWKDKTTPIDVYAYYPAGNPEKVTAYPFTIQKDQSKPAQGGVLGGYEASDFLWGKAANVAPTEQKIRVPLAHRFSSAKVMLQEGTGFQPGEWLNLEKSVLVKNVKHQATVSLADGSVQVTGEVSKAGIIPYQKDQAFRAIVVPQVVAAATPLFTITVDGTVYHFKKAEPFTYVSGKMHNFTIKVDKKEATGEFTFSLAGESITAWENDDVSHDATMKEYVVIHSEPGKLQEAIAAAKKDYTKLRNLKITGAITTADFTFMRDQMTALESLNLKEVELTCSWYGDNTIPEHAFEYKTSLLRLILPDKLKKIGSDAFHNCSNLAGSLLIPEGVTHIGGAAFDGCRSLDGKLILPSTLEYIDFRAFNGCNFISELKIPAGVTYIGSSAFADCQNLYGELHLPDNLMNLGEYAFSNCLKLEGSLKIPQKITTIKNGTFNNCMFNGLLFLHEGIVSIGADAFSNCRFKGELILPSQLKIIGDDAFIRCNFSGELQLPSTLLTVGNRAFMLNDRLMGTLRIPESLQTIGSEAFSNCSHIERVIFPKGLESIGASAFENCFGIGSIVCEEAIPPVVLSGAFNGVPKDNFTLEVPEAAVPQYQTAPGWNEFKRIAAHHELVCRPSIANALNTQTTRRLVLNAEGDWEVDAASLPDWCCLSQTSGHKKTELTLTIHELPKGSAPRTAEIVFRLKGKNYTHKCTVNQYDYQYGEDEVVTLQKATKGSKGGINLVFLGDGYDAKDISEGKFLKDIQQQVEYFFAIEPYKTYRDYFNVYTAMAVSTESGIGSVNTIRYSKFETTFTGGGLKCNSDAVFTYAQKVPTVTRDNLKESLVVLTPNTTEYGGITEMWADGSAIAICPMSTDPYPYDARGVVQHEAGGHGFGKLGDEYIYHNAFISACACSCCEHESAVVGAKANGWYDNLSLTGKMHEVPWSHLIFDPRYSNIVDIYEGGFMHSRGVFRSEQNSCMNNNIPYYSTISRESIVKRIKRYAGEPYSFEEFVKNDKRDAATTPAVRQGAGEWNTGRSGQHHSPRIHEGSPLR